MAHLLLVDDDPIVLRALLRKLATTHTCTTACNGVEAIRKMRWRNDDAFCFDLIISDVDMPFMTGLDLYLWICMHHPSQSNRLIFYTGSHVPLLESFGVPIIRKGLELDQTLSKVSLYLDGVTGVRDTARQ